MKTANKILLLVGAVQLLSAAVHAKMEYAVIDRAALLRESKSGKALLSQLEAEARSLQEAEQKKAEELRAEEASLRSKMKVLSPAAQQAEFAALQRKAKKLQNGAQEAAAEFDETAKMRQQMLDQKNLEIASALFQEKEWGVMFDKNIALAVNKKLDVTKDVLERIDAEYEASLQASVGGADILEA